MKKAFPLFVLIILVFFLPPVRADSESLYVDSYTGDLANWDERNEPSPYLADESTGFVHEVKSSGATEGYFGFANPGGTGTINSVTLYIECYGQDTNDKIIIYVDCSDGSGWVNEGEVIVNQLSYDWETLSLSTRLDSWPDIQNAQIYFYYQGVGGGDDIFARRAYLYVDYTPAGDEYIRELSQQFSYSVVSYRLCDIERDNSQGLTFSSESNRGWSLTRILTQSILFTSDLIADLTQFIFVQLSQGMNIASNSIRQGGYQRSVSEIFSFSSGIERAFSAIRNPTQSITASVEALRSWSPTRTLSQSISFTSNTLVKHFQNFIREMSLGLNIASESLRSWTLSRNMAQTITLSTTANTISNYIRTVQQGLSFSIESFAKIIAEGGEAFYRTVAMGLDFTSNSIRWLSIKRIVGQTIFLESTWNSVFEEESDPDFSPYGVIVIHDETMDEPTEPDTTPYVLETAVIVAGSAISYIYNRRRKLL